MSFRTRVILAFAAIYLVWGSTYLAIRFTIETLPPLLTAGIRFILAGLILMIFVYVKERPAMPNRQHWRSSFIIGALLLLGGNGSVVWAEHYVPSGLAALVIATTPLWMVLLQWLWKKGKRPSLGVLAGIGAGFGGVAILMVPNVDSGFTGIHLGGAAALVVATISWAVGSVHSKTAVVPKSPFLATGMQMLAGGVLLFMMGIFLGEMTSIHPEQFSTKSLMAFVYLILVGSLVGFTAYIWLIKNVGVTKASTYAFVNPIVAVVLGCALAGEELNAHIGIAAVFILMAVVFITTYHREPVSVSS